MRGTVFKLSFWVFFAFVALASGFAQAQENDQNPFCSESPFTVICADDSAQASELESPLEILGAYASKHHLGLVPSVPSVWNGERWLQYMRRLDQIARRMSQELGFDPEGSLKAMQTHLKQALGLHQSELEFHPGRNLAGLLHELDQVRYVTFSEYMARSGWLTRRVFHDLCGSDGAEANAQYVPGENILVVCPGRLAQVATQARTREEAEDLLVSDIGHELGHVVRNFLYQPRMDQCWGTLRGAPVSESQVMGQKLGADYWKEVSSDFWGIEAQILFFDARAARPQRIHNALAKAYQPYCRQKDVSGDHSPWQFRVDQVVGKNIRLRRRLGCERSAPVTDSCGLQGRE